MDMTVTLLVWGADPGWPSSPPLVKLAAPVIFPRWFARAARVDLKEHSSGLHLQGRAQLALAIGLSVCRNLWIRAAVM